MDEIQQLKHRLAMVLDDIMVIRQHIYTQNISRCFEESTPMADECWTHLNNIEIACDLNSDESLNWKPFLKSEEKQRIMKQTDYNLHSLDDYYFLVERPKAVIHELERCFEDVVNTTRANNATASVVINGIVKMYLPNSLRHNEDLSNQYCVLRLKEDSLETADFYLTDRLDHAMDRILELIEEKRPLRTLLKKLDSEARVLKTDSRYAHSIARADGMLDVIQQINELITNTNDQTLRNL